MNEKGKEVMGAEAIATDFSSEMIKKAMENGKDRGSNVPHKSAR